MIRAILNFPIVRRLAYWPRLIRARRLNRSVFDSPAMMDLFEKTQKLTEEIRSASAACLEKSDNLAYFRNVVEYSGLHAVLPFKNQAMLYAPNVAALDFLLKNGQPDSDVILDYACGMGYLIAYLSRGMGFRNVFGYDTFQQVRERTIRAFLRRLGLDGALLGERSHVQQMNPNVLVIIGIPFDWLDQDTIDILLGRKSLKWVLLDPSYCFDLGGGHPEWSVKVTYPRLLHVWERN